MGMGKTAVCAALVCASKAKHGRMLTVVLVNNSLVGQWLDELEKFAPLLHVCRYYGSKQPINSWTDIVVTTPRTQLPEVVYPRVRRLIIDESHLYEPKSEPKLPSTQVFEKYAKSIEYIWCVTGTPVSTSLEQLEWQARMLGHWEYGLCLYRAVRAPEARDVDMDTGKASYPFMTNEQIADKLKQLMIRHSKSQRISGEAALSLPDADSDVVWLTMSDDERALYKLHCCADGVPKWADASRVTELKLADVASGLGRRRHALASVYDENAVTGNSSKQHYSLSRPGPGGLRGRAISALTNLGANLNRFWLPPVDFSKCTKYKALVADIAALRATSPNASVVIFTHYNETLGQVCALLRSADPSLTVFEVSRTISPARRHSALRQFQSGHGGAKVFATTFATAAVGLTLTAASRVYLLEASLDPAQEAQAAGRIHRLGQDKEVLVRRFFFKDSLDEAIWSLHGKIRRGEVALEGGRFPPAALAVFREHGVAMPHTADLSAPMVPTLRRYKSGDRTNMQVFGGDGGFDYGKTVQTRPCLYCGKPVEVEGTSLWWGKGKMAPLQGDTADTPAFLSTFNLAPDENEEA